MVKFYQLECFVTVVENGSINRAAEQLYVTQPTLSKTLKSLEAEIGKQLLIRKNHGVVPTREGKLLYRYAKTILSELKVVEKLKQMNADEIYSELRFSIYSLFMNDDVFTSFYENSLSEEIVLHVNEESIEDLISNVYEGTSEFGIAVLSDLELPAVQRTLHARKMNFIELGKSPMCIHLHKEHKLASKAEICMQDMIDSSYVHLPYDMYSNLRLGTKINNLTIRDLKRNIAVNNYRLLILLLKEANCFALGNIWQKDVLEKQSILTKCIKNCDVEMHMLMITSKKDDLSIEAEKFMKNIKICYGF